MEHQNNTNNNAAVSVINQLNAECEGRWSFRIIEHEFRDNEIIVLGELTINNATRQCFGHATIAFYTDDTAPPSMAATLGNAADDALVQCAHTFGIQEPTANNNNGATTVKETVEQTPPNNGNGNSERVLTNKQLAAIYGLGKSKGHSQQDIIHLTQERFGKDPIDLLVTEASEIIGDFINNNGKDTQS